MIFCLGFASNTIISCVFFFFLIIDLYFLIFAVVTEIFIFIAELAIPTGMPTKEGTEEIETHPVNVEAKISRCSV